MLESKIQVKDESIRVLRLDIENLRNDMKIQWERELEEWQKVRDEKPRCRGRSMSSERVRTILLQR